MYVEVKQCIYVTFSCTTSCDKDLRLIDAAGNLRGCVQKLCIVVDDLPCRVLDRPIVHLNGCHIPVFVAPDDENF